MGNIASKKPGVTELKTPEKSSPTTSVEHSPESPSTDAPAIPPTPAVPQTPLTETIANHLNRIAAHDVNHNQKIRTPSYLLRKKILYDLGYTYSLKENDPRSPSHCIPRTPLNLDTKNGNNTTEPINETDVSSFQYNSTLEDSCREFNSKLDEITMDEADIAQHDVSLEKIDTKCIETVENLCDQKTPDAENQIPPDFVQNTSSIDDDKSLNKILSPTNCGDNIDDQNSSETTTPVMSKSHRTGRIPLSVINRRVGMSAENSTPLQSKNTSGLSGHHDENRNSARKSKIPVFKK